MPNPHTITSEGFQKKSQSDNRSFGVGAKLLMISGDRSLAQGKRGAFFNTLEEFHKYWERIDIITPRVRGPASPHPHGTQLLFARHGGPPVESPLTLFDNVFIHSSPWPLIFQPWWILKKGRELYFEQKFDLITVHEYPPFYNGLGAKILWNKINPVKSGEAGVAKQQFNRVKVPYVLEIHHIVGHPKAADLKEKIYKWLSHIFLKLDSSKAKAVRVVNQKQVPEFLIKAGVPKEKITYIPSVYIDSDVFKPMNLEKKYDLIFVGRLVKNKGINLFLETIKRLNLKAAIVGDGPLKNYLKSEIEDNKLKVDLLGWIENQKDIAEILNKSQILVITSYNEGGPRVLLEAMACGIPVITTRVGIAEDLIKDGENGFFTDWSGESIGEKVSILLENTELQRKFISSGLETAKKFEKKSSIQNYAKNLQKLIV